MNLSLKKEDMKAVTDMPFNIGTSVDAQVKTGEDRKGELRRVEERR